jgi:thioredoxin-like negative regulator of GroEL
VEKVAEELRGEVSFYKVDTDHSPELAERFGIQAIPTLLRFVDGKKAAEVLGFQPEAGVRRFARGAE